MKEITRIHLAQTPYEIEIEAKKQLEKYLRDVEKSLQADADAMREIEARIAELLSDRGVTQYKVVTAGDVVAIREQLGEPGEFIDETEAAVEIKAERRIMRDTEDGVLGGVLAGIATYYNINVVWLRLAAVVLGIVSIGTAFLLYVMLWLIIPAAKTAADRLQLRGEPVTLEAIKSNAGQSIALNTKSKPLVVLLRILLGLGWLGGALLSIVAIAAVLFGVFGIGSFDSVGELRQFEAAGVQLPLLGLAGMVFAGILAAVFCVVAAYVSFVWKMTKTIATSLVVTAIVGVTVFAASLGTVFYGIDVLDRQIAENTHTETTQLNKELANVKKLKIENKGDVTVQYRVISGSPYAENMFYKPDETSKSNVSFKIVAGENGTATLKVKKAESNCRHAVCSKMEINNLTIYGPALSNVELTENTRFEYSATSQQALNVAADRNATFALTGGLAENMIIAAGQYTHIDASQAGVTTVKAVTQYGSTLRFGNVQLLDVAVPSSCPVNGEVSVFANRAASVTFDKKEINQSGDNNTDCLKLEFGDKEDSFDIRDLES